MTAVERHPASLRDYVLQFQTRHPSIEQTVTDIMEPYALQSRNGCTLTAPILMMVSRVINDSRFLLVPFLAHNKCGAMGALLSETAFDEFITEFPDLKKSFGIGSIIEAELYKTEMEYINAPFISHFVARVGKIWDLPLFPLHSGCNILQITVEVDLSQPGRCRKELTKDEAFFILSCKFGMEVSISVDRLGPHLSNNMTMDNTILECKSIMMAGAPTSFRILDTCTIIKKTIGMENVRIPARGKSIPEDFSKNDDADG